MLGWLNEGLVVGWLRVETISLGQNKPSLAEKVIQVNELKPQIHKPSPWWDDRLSSWRPSKPQLLRMTSSVWNLDSAEVEEKAQDKYWDISSRGLSRTKQGSRVAIVQNYMDMTKMLGVLQQRPARGILFICAVETAFSVCLEDFAPLFTTVHWWCSQPTRTGPRNGG